MVRCVYDNRIWGHDVTMRTISALFANLLILLLPGTSVGADRPQLVLQTGSHSRPEALAFDPDGRLLASMSGDGSTIKVWDWAAGHELRTFNKQSVHDVTGTTDLVFTADGSRLIAINSGTVKTWDIITGRELASTTLRDVRHSTQILGAAGGLAATIESDGMGGEPLRIWRAQAGTEIRSLVPTGLILSQDNNKSAGASPDLKSARFLATAFSTDGRFFATCERTSLAVPHAASIRIWQTSTGREERGIQVHESPSAVEDFYEGTRAMAFSGDGRWLALLVRNETSMDPPQIADSVIREGPTAIVDFMLKQKKVVENRVQIWNVSTGEQVLQWSISTTADLGDDGVNHGLLATHALCFTSEGSILAAAVSEDTVKVFGLPSGREIGSWKLASGITSIAVDPPGHVLAVGHMGNTVTLLNLENGQLLRRLDSTVVPSTDIAWSPNGRELRAANQEGAITWDLESGVSRRTVVTSGSPLPAFLDHPGSPLRAFLDRQGRLLGTSSVTDASATLFNASTGIAVSSIRMLDSTRMDLGTFSPDGTLLAIVETRMFGTSPYNMQTPLQARSVLEVILATSDARVRQSSGRDQIQKAIDLLSEEFHRRSLSFGLGSGSALPQLQVKLFDVASGKMLRTLVGDRHYNEGYVALAFSPDGRVLAAVPSQPAMKIEMWEVQSGHRVPFAVELNGFFVSKLVFSPDGRTLVGSLYPTLSHVGTIVLWDATTGKELGTIPVEHGNISALAFSPDGKILAIGSDDATIALCHFDTRRMIRTLTGHTGTVSRLVFRPDGRVLASASEDGSVRLWDVQSGAHLATLLSLTGADWLVTTSDGLFDGSPAAWGQILWRFSEKTLDVAPVEVFLNEFYYPGLLADIASGKRPRPPQQIAEKDRHQPKLELSVDSRNSTVNARTISVRVSIIEAPAGAQDVRLFRNGSLVKMWHGDVLRGQNTATLEATIPLVAGENRLTAYAFNHDNIKSSDAMLVLHRTGANERRGVAYILTVGIDNYANSNYNLRYAVADARDFGAEVKRQQENLGQYERVEVIPLFNDRATKAGILSTLDKLADLSQPEDAVIVYYAGHGTAHNSRFYLIPHDLGYRGKRTELNPEGLERILEHGISDLDLNRAFERLDAARAILVIDACNSGQALEAEEKRRGPMNSKGLAQLAYEKGMYILTAAQSYQAALEAARLGHGYLTYALVEEGLKRQSADFEPRDGVVLAREWLDYAAMRVPEMQTEKVGNGRLLVQEQIHSAKEHSDQRAIQRPRLFYRREVEETPLIVAKSH
jgi:WD40 repeat protein